MKEKQHILTERSALKWAQSLARGYHVCDEAIQLAQHFALLKQSSAGLGLLHIKEVILSIYEIDQSEFHSQYRELPLAN